MTALPLSLQAQLFARPGESGNPHSSDWEPLLNEAFSSKHYPQARCAWKPVQQWYSSVAHAQSSVGVAQTSIPSAAFDGSERAAASALLRFTTGRTLDSFEASGNQQCHNFHPTVPEELEGKGVAQVLPFTNLGSLSSIHTLQSLQKLGSSFCFVFPREATVSVTQASF